MPETEAIVGDVKPADVAAPRTSNERPAPARPAAPRPARKAETPPARSTPRPAPTWPVSVPSGFPTEPNNAPQAAAEPAPAPIENTQVEAARAPEPPPVPEKQFEELVVSANSVIGLQLDGSISSDRAAIEDRVEARVVRDVRVGNDVAIPAGARALGSVTLVERGGKFKERARLGIRFHTLVLADGTRLPITSEAIYRNGDAPGNASAAKIGGGAVAGAILGAIIGGAKGAAVGATAGAGGGTAAVMAGDAQGRDVPVRDRSHRAHPVAGHRHRREARTPALSQHSALAPGPQPEERVLIAEGEHHRKNRAGGGALAQVNKAVKDGWRTPRLFTVSGRYDRPSESEDHHEKTAQRARRRCRHRVCRRPSAPSRSPKKKSRASAT